MGDKPHKPRFLNDQEPFQKCVFTLQLCQDIYIYNENLSWISDIAVNYPWGQQSPLQVADRYRWQTAAAASFSRCPSPW